MKTLSLKLPDALDRELAARAEEAGVSKSQVVREALTGFLHRGETPRKGSLLALAGDLAGCVEGPGDLSFNKEHLNGYGR